MARRASQRAYDAKNMLVSGAILKLYCTDLKIKNGIKRFLVFAVSIKNNSIAKLYFDSICPPIPYQLQFQPNGYLERTSYLDCSEIYEDNYDRIINLLTNNPKAFIGQMAESDLKIVRNQIEIANTIPQSVKQKYDIINSTI